MIALSRGWTVQVLLDEALLTLNRVVGIVRRRNVPFESYSVGPAGEPGLARLTISVPADEATIQRMVGQLRKTVGIRSASALPPGEQVERELALVRVATVPGRVAGILDAAALFDAQIVEEDGSELVLQVVGDAAFVQSFLRALEPFGVRDVVRSGALALARPGQSPGTPLTQESTV